MIDEKGMTVREGIEFVSKAKPQPNEFICYSVRDLTAFKLTEMRVREIDKMRGIQVIEGRLIESPEKFTPRELMFFTAYGWNEQKIQAWLDQHPEYKPLPPLPKAPVYEATTLAQKMRRWLKW